MADFAPRRAGHPQRSVVTVAELLGRSDAPDAGGRTGRPTAATSVRPAEVPVPVSILIRRTGVVPDPSQHDAAACADRVSGGLGAPRRRLLTSAGAMLAVGSIAGTALMFSDSTPGPDDSGALGGGYPTRQLLDPSGGQPTGGPGAGLPVAFEPMALTGPLTSGGGAGLPGVGGVPRSAPPGPGPAPAARTPGTAARTGGLLGSVVGPLRGGVGGGTVGGVVRSGGGVGGVGGDLHDTARGSLGNPVRALGDTAGNGTPTARDDGAGPRVPAGSALSSLTSPITVGDAAGSRAGRARSPERAGKHAAKRSRRHADDTLSTVLDGASRHGTDTSARRHEKVAHRAGEAGRRAEKSLLRSEDSEKRSGASEKRSEDSDRRSGKSDKRSSSGKRSGGHGSVLSGLG